MGQPFVLTECLCRGQGFELRAIMPDGPVAAKNIAPMTNGFHDQHQLDYGDSYRDAELELITRRAIGSAASRKIEIPEVQKSDGSSIHHARACSLPIY